MSQNRKNWTDFEDRAITILVKRYGTKNWAEISEKMSSKYGIDTRSGKQCRQRWHNHLDPSINKQTWSTKEEKLMFEAHQKYGNKWTEIARLFEGRTDNDIKNHFYSMLRRSLRRINKMLGRRNSTQKIKVIKPSVLSKIFVNIGIKDEKRSQQCKKISQALYQFSNTKPDNDHSQSLQLEQKKRLEDLIERLSRYNDEYQMSQLLKRQSKKSQNSQNSIENIKSPPPVAIPTMNKQPSQMSIHSTKSKKIKRLIRRKSSQKQLMKQQEQQGKIRRTRNTSGSKKVQKESVLLKNQDATIKEVFVTSDKDKEGQKFYMTRLRRNQSGLSLGEEFCLPDLNSKPSQEGNMRFRNNSNIFSHSPGFSLGNNANVNFFSGPSPQAQFRSWTPLCPSPNISDFFSRGGANYEWKPNNDDFENVLTQMRREIEQQNSKIE